MIGQRSVVADRSVLRGGDRSTCYERRKWLTHCTLLRRGAVISHNNVSVVNDFLSSCQLLVLLCSATITTCTVQILASVPTDGSHPPRHAAPP